MDFLEQTETLRHLVVCFVNEEGVRKFDSVTSGMLRKNINHTIPDLVN